MQQHLSLYYRKDERLRRNDLGRNHEGNRRKKNRNNNHFENVDEFIKEAQERWIELKLEEYSEAFSLRLTGTHRLYGILEDGTFRVIWYDEDHEIYKSTKRHT